MRVGAYICVCVCVWWITYIHTDKKVALALVGEAEGGRALKEKKENRKMVVDKKCQEKAACAHLTHHHV